MNALTHDLRSASPAAKRAAPAARKKGFWACVFDAIVESRTRRAEDELRASRHLVADILARHGFKTTYRNADKLPFAKRNPDQPVSLPNSSDGSDTAQSPEMPR